MRFRRSKRLQGVRVTSSQVINTSGAEEEDDIGSADNVNNDQTGNRVQVRRKGRGPSRAKDVWDLPKDHRIEVEFNDFGQPHKASASILSDFLGTIARNGILCPLHYLHWRKFQEGELDEILNTVKARFTIITSANSSANTAKAYDYILKSVDNKWKNYKCKLKAKYFKKDLYSIADIINNVPEDVNAHQWKDLVHNWNTEESQRASELGRRARSAVRTLHASGPISFAQRRYQFHQEHNRSPSRMEAFYYQHRGADGNFVNEDAQLIMEEASNMMIARSVPVISVSQKIALENEIYDELVGVDRYGRPRGFGLGVTSADLGGSTNPSRNEHYEAMFRQYEATIKEQSEALGRAQMEQTEALERVRAEQAEAIERVRAEQAEAIERVRADARAEMLAILRGYDLTKPSCLVC